MVQPLNFPSYSFRLKSKENKKFIYDIIRKKFVSLQPEEWVRQHCIHYLMKEQNIPSSLINVERTLILNGLKKRYDIVVYYPDGSIFMIIECKSQKIAITQKTFNQIAQYNLVLDASYLMITNGEKHYFAKLDFKKKNYLFLKEFPKFSL